MRPTTLHQLSRSYSTFPIRPGLMVLILTLLVAGALKLQAHQARTPVDEKDQEQNGADKEEGEAQENTTPPEILARVGEEVITRRQLILDINSRGRKEIPESPAEVLRQLAERSLLRQRARSLGIVITDKTIEGFYVAQAQKAGGPEEFEAALRYWGYTAKNWKENIRDQYIFREIMRDRQDIRHKIQVTPQEIRNYWINVHPKKRVDPAKVKIEAALISSSKAGGIEACREEAEKLRQMLLVSSDFKGAVESIEAARVIESFPEEIVLDDRDQGLIGAALEFARTEPEEGTVSQPLLMDGSPNLMILRSTQFTPKAEHVYTFDEVQDEIEAKLGDMKWDSLRRRYVREIAPEYEIWPEDLIKPLKKKN